MKCSNFAIAMLEHFYLLTAVTPNIGAVERNALEHYFAPDPLSPNNRLAGLRHLHGLYAFSPKAQEIRQILPDFR